jgi:hypothetical protein
MPVEAILYRLEGMIQLFAYWKLQMSWEILIAKMLIELAD